MKNWLKNTIMVSMAVLPQVSFAQFDPAGGPLGELMSDILLFVNDYVIPFIIGIGFLFFVWGMFKYFILGGADEEKKLQGRSLMIHATLGFVLIIIFFGIVNLITSSTGLEGQVIENIPEISL